MMILWQKQATPQWLAANESLLEEIAGSDLAVISRPGRMRSQVQVICRRRAGARETGAHVWRSRASLCHAIGRKSGDHKKLAPQSGSDAGLKSSANRSIRKKGGAQTPAHHPRGWRLRHRRTRDDRDVDSFAGRNYQESSAWLAIVRRRHWHRNSRSRRAAARRQRSSGPRRRSPGRGACAPERAAQSDFTGPLHCGGSIAMEAIRALRGRHGQSLQRTADRRIADFSSRSPRQWSPHRFRHSARAGRIGRARAPPGRVSARETTAREMDRASLPTDPLCEHVGAARRKGTASGLQGCVSRDGLRLQEPSQKSTTKLSRTRH